MSKRTDIKKSLIDVGDSVLIVIDMQDSFLMRYGSKVSKPVVEKAVWVIKLAQVAVLKDVVATTTGDEDIGIDRMRQAGAVISSAKAITYEWLRTVSNVDAAFDESAAGLEKLVPDCLEL